MNSGPEFNICLMDMAP